MIPIFEQGRSQGIGHSVDTFIGRFDDILREHLADGRAQAFAFIFYDFNDASVRKILKDQGVFAKLDRLSGDRLSIFYLHRGGEKSIEKFNAQFLTTLDVHEIAGLPCVVFFKFKDDQIEDVQVVQLDNANLIHGFFELFTVVENYLDHAAKKPSESRGLKWIKSGSKFIGIEAFRAALRQSLDNWF